MGTIHHNFVVAVVTYGHERAAKAFEEVKDFARELSDEYFTHHDGYEGLLCGPINGVVNLTTTYFLAPDGSKEGWEASHSGDVLRRVFIEKMTEAGASVADGSFGELEDTFVVH